MQLMVILNTPSFCALIIYSDYQRTIPDIIKVYRMKYFIKSSLLSKFKN